MTLKEYVTVVGVENYFKGVTGRKPQPLETLSVPVFASKTKDKVDPSVYRKTSGPNIDEMKREISKLKKENRELSDVNHCLTETVSKFQTGTLRRDTLVSRTLLAAMFGGFYYLAAIQLAKLEFLNNIW